MKDRYNPAIGSILLFLFPAFGILFPPKGCKKSAENYVNVPTTDPTPPTVGMNVNDSKKNIDVSESSQRDTLHAGSDKVSILAGATDNDGGIKSVQLWAVITRTVPGTIPGPGLAGKPIKQDSSTAKVGESTLKNRFFQHVFDMKKELGLNDQVRIEVWTIGENFYGSKVRTPTVVILYP